MNIKSNGKSRFIFLLPKAYIIAIPVVLLVCAFAGDYKILLNVSPQGEYLNNKAIVNMFVLIEIGYVICLLILSVDLFFAKRFQNKRAFWSAMLFLMIDIIFMIVLYPGTLVVHQQPFHPSGFRERTTKQLRHCKTPMIDWNTIIRDWVCR